MRGLGFMAPIGLAAGVVSLVGCEPRDGCRCEGDSGDGVNPTFECTELVLTPVDHPAFNGSGPCGGVAGRYVLTDQAAVDAHVAEFCALQEQCEEPAPPCEPPPELYGDIVYLFVSVPACETSVSIDMVRACGDSPRVNYVFDKQGDCTSEVGTWAAVMVDDLGDDEPIFIEESPQ